MISTWREFPPSPPKQREPAPEPHIFDGVTAEQNAAMTKSNQETTTAIASMIDHMPADQQSMFDNYKKGREAVFQQAHTDNAVAGMGETVRAVARDNGYVK